MAENDETPNADDTTAIDPAAVPPATVAATPAATGPRLRDTVWNFRSMIAVAVASLLIGGATGAAITAVSSHDGHRERIRISDFRGGEGMKHLRGGRGFGNGQFGGPGQGLNQYGPDGSPLGPGGTLPGGPGIAPAPGATPATPSAPATGSSG